MKSSIIVLCAALLAGAFVLSCDEERYTPVKPGSDQPTFKSLTEKDDVLYNVELCFNEFNDTEYDKLLDADYINYFSEADYKSGLTPAQWDRATEMRSYAGFFDPNRSENRVTSRSLVLTYPPDNWTEIDPLYSAQYPAEKWYMTTVTYDLSVEIDIDPPVTYVANHLQLEVTIRWDDEKGHYRMVRWRDDVGGKSLRSLLTSGASVEGSTWGSIKTLFS